MANQVVRCPSLTIANGAASSNVIKASEVYADADAIALFAPAVLDAHTFVIEVTADVSASPVVWNVLSDAVSDVGPPAAGKCVIYPAPAIEAFRITDQSGNVAADRTFKMLKIYNMSR